MTHADTNSLKRCIPLRQLYVAMVVAVLLMAPRLAWAEGSPTSHLAPAPARVIGATAIVTAIGSDVKLAARVDTGAATCSMHCDAFEIEQASSDPKENIGKCIRFRTKGLDGKAKWLCTKVADFVVVKTAEHDDERYTVRLRLRCENVEKEVLVTLNNREKMTYPMLLGRNFLRDDFLVNVSLEDDK